MSIVLVHSCIKESFIYLIHSEVLPSQQHRNSGSVECTPLDLHTVVYKQLWDGQSVKGVIFISYSMMTL